LKELNMAEIIGFLFAWYNLPFTLMLLACLVLAALQWIGLGGEQEHEAGADTEVHADLDHDVDADLHADLDHDLDHDLDTNAELHGDVEHDLEHDIDHGADHEADHSTVQAANGFSLLAYLGAGRAPLMIILLILLGSVGLLGWIFNGIVHGVLGVFPGVAMLLTVPASLVCGAVISARLSRLIGQVLPPLSTTATSEHAMVGRRAVVVSPWVDQRSGQVRLRNPGGTLINVFATTGSAETIRRGEEVILMEWDQKNRVYHVVRG
jgi:membrane protein implicated in regulation of membrane protease activity